MKKKIIALSGLLLVLALVLPTGPVMAAPTTPVGGTVTVTCDSWEILGYTALGVIGQARNTVVFEGDFEGKAREIVNFSMTFEGGSIRRVTEGFQHFEGTLLDGNGGTFHALVSRYAWGTADALNETCRQVITTSTVGLEGLVGTIYYELACSGNGPRVGAYAADMIIGTSPLQPAWY